MDADQAKYAQLIEMEFTAACTAVSFLGFANNHSIHHRGQLAACLRAHGAKVPAIYGASAGEPMKAS